jgi:hypothetical protein
VRAHEHHGAAHYTAGAGSWCWHQA